MSEYKTDVDEKYRTVAASAGERVCRTRGGALSPQERQREAAAVPTRARCDMTCCELHLQHKTEMNRRGASRALAQSTVAPIRKFRLALISWNMNVLEDVVHALQTICTVVCAGDTSG